MDPAESFGEQTRGTSSIRKRHLIPSCLATDRSEFCRRFPGDSAFSTVVLRPSVASQGQRRLIHRLVMTGKTSRRSCPFETSTSSLDHERVQLSYSSPALDPDSLRSAPGSNSERTRPAWPSARSRRCWAVWRTWRGNCCRAVWLPLTATTTRWWSSVVWRKCTGSCRAARRKSRSADNPRGAAAAARCSRRLCNNRCWCTRSVRRCCTRTSSRNEPRSGSPFFVSYLPRFSTEKKKKGRELRQFYFRALHDLFTTYFPNCSSGMIRLWREIAFVSRWSRGSSSLFTILWIGTRWSRLRKDSLSTFIYQNEHSLIVIVRRFF